MPPPAPKDLPKVKAVLLVSSSDETRSPLLSILAATVWNVHLARSCEEAEALLRRHDIRIVICDARFAGGGWRDLLRFVDRMSLPVSLIVTAPVADEALWAEVLNLGGYDVLAQPFEEQEVVRIGMAAFRHATRGESYSTQPARYATA